MRIGFLQIERIEPFGDVLNTLPESAARDERELALQVARIAPLQNSQGHGMPRPKCAAASILAERATARSPARCQYATACSPRPASVK